MTTVFSENNPTLKDLWEQHNPQNDEYLEREKVKEWVKVALEQTNALQNFEQSLTDLDGLIKTYLTEVHNASEEELQNSALNFIEAVEFLKWLTNTEEQPGKNEQSDKPSSPKEQKEEEQSAIKPLSDGEQPSKEQESEVKQIERQPSQEELPQGLNEQPQQLQHHAELHNSPTSPQISHTEEDPSQLPPQSNERISHKAKTEQRPQDDYDNMTTNLTEMTPQQLARKYKEFLRVIFEHYCKISYATGQDPTFEQIQHKTTVMTINKFMIFSKDFEFSKLGKSVNRTFLIETFKKNAECYKEMSFEQFGDVINKMAEMFFGEGAKENNNEFMHELPPQIDGLPQSLQKMLDFLEISNARKFREKMKRLNIQYRQGPRTNAEMKVVPEGYKFKFTSNNGKSAEQVKQELQERKQHRSQRKIQLREKLNTSQNHNAHRKKAQKYQEVNLSRDRKLGGRDNVQSVHHIPKVPTPSLPSTHRKTPNVPPLPKPKAAHAQPLSQSDNVFKREMGYAQMYKLKKAESHGGRRKANTGSSNSNQGIFKLNSIVEEARQEVMEAPPPRLQPISQGHSENLSESIATNSREEVQRSHKYDIHKINNNMQLINDKIARKRQIQQELSGLLDITEDDDDEFLKEHLHRQKKNQVIGKRLSNRISQLQQS